VKPVDFDLHQPEGVAEAVGLLARYADEDAKVLAGGQSLLPLLNFRLARPRHVIDVGRVASLTEIRRTAAGVTVGAMARQAQAERSRSVAIDVPLLAAALPHIAHPPVRNRGTVGGSLAHADPAAELPAALLALDAGVVAAGRAGHRRLPLAELFVGLLTTALAPDEILTGIEIPEARAAGWGFAELARRAGDFAIAGVAAVVHGGPDRCTGARLVAFGADDRPVRLRAAEDAIVGRAPSAALAARAAAEAPRDCRPSSDVHASAEYRAHLVRVLAEDAVRDAVGRLAA
jgi:carbon-monoxide dehydrogenase medium subunit